MTAQAMKQPSAEHPITITPATKRIVVSVGGKVIADSKRALALQEASYPVAYYIPRADVDMTQLSRTEHSTYCPYKGDCSYFNIPVGGERSVNAVWSYEQPYPAVAQIQDHLAFYPNRVDAIEER